MTERPFQLLHAIARCADRLRQDLQAAGVPLLYTEAVESIERLTWLVHAGLYTEFVQQEGQSNEDK